jgi:hypothetical protein
LHQGSIFASFKIKDKQIYSTNRNETSYFDSNDTNTSLSSIQQRDNNNYNQIQIDLADVELAANEDENYYDDPIDDYN